MWLCTTTNDVINDFTFNWTRLIMYTCQDIVRLIFFCPINFYEKNEKNCLCHLVKFTKLSKLRRFLWIQNAKKIWEIFLKLVWFHACTPAFLPYFCSENYNFLVSIYFHHEKYHTANCQIYSTWVKRSKGRPYILPLVEGHDLL